MLSCLPHCHAAAPQCAEPSVTLPEELELGWSEDILPEVRRRELCLEQALHLLGVRLLTKVPSGLQSSGGSTAAAQAAEQAALASSRLSGVGEPASDGGVLSRAPQKYLIQNQSGMKVFYWADGGRVSWDWRARGRHWGWLQCKACLGAVWAGAFKPVAHRHSRVASLLGLPTTGCELLLLISGICLSPHSIAHFLHLVLPACPAGRRAPLQGVPPGEWPQRDAASAARLQAPVVCALWLGGHRQ